MRSKRYKTNKQLIDKTKVYSIDEAIEILQKAQKAKFDESVELHCKLNIDPEKSEQQTRAGVELPHGTGKNVKVVVFAEDPALVQSAKDNGAEIVGGEQLIEKIRTKGKIDFDVAVATPDMMPKMAKIAKILGPRGLMPNPKNETITKNIAQAVAALKKGKVNFKSDKSGNIHAVIGKISFTPETLKENYEVFKKALEKAKPGTVKGKFIRSITLSSTMGGGIKIAN